MLYAVILKTTINIKEFRSTKGLYNKECYDLRQAGYTILTIDVTDPALIEQQLAHLPDASIGFLWNRMHGAPKAMAAGQSNDITSDNIPNLFSWLPKKLTTNAIIYLDACSTASLKQDFYNNIQFTFAKLTLEMPDVQIVGPAEDSHIEAFSINAQGEFSFKMFANPRASCSMAVRLQKETKLLLKEAFEQKTPLDSIKKSLEDSLVKGGQFGYFLNFFDTDLHEILLDINGYDLEEATIVTILRVEDQDCIKHIKDFIEKFHVSLTERSSIRDPLSWDHATFLSTAICANKPRVVSYLLGQGVDPRVEVFNNETLYDFVKRKSESKSSAHYKCMLLLIDQHLEQLNIQEAQRKLEFLPAYKCLLASLDIMKKASEKLDNLNLRLSACEHKMKMVTTAK